MCNFYMQFLTANGPEGGRRLGHVTISTSGPVSAAQQLYLRRWVVSSKWDGNSVVAGSPPTDGQTGPDRPSSSQ